MSTTPINQPAIYDPDLVEWAKNSGLEDILYEFLTVNEGPPDGRYLIKVCELMQRTTARALFWREVEPFKRWVPFVDQVVNDSTLLQQTVGAHLYPPLPRRNKAGNAINFLHGKITHHQIFAMLLDEHQDPNLRVQYGSLQLHVVLARWIEAEKTTLELQKTGGGKQITLLEVLRIGREHDDRVRLTDHIARTVRDLSGNDFTKLLEHFEADKGLDRFRGILGHPDKVPRGDSFQKHFEIISNWCLKHSGARVGGHHSPGDSSRGRRPSFAEYVGYGNLRLGLNLPAEDGQPVEQVILNRAGNDDETFQLGLHPLERSGGGTAIGADVEGSANAGEATAIARSHSRHFEINRRLFPWSSDQLRLEEFRRGILPALVRACQSDSLGELEIATLVAIMVDTGRDADHVLAMPIERNPNAWLCYRKPLKQSERGGYYWSAIEPQYKTPHTADADKELPRATYMRFPASMLVTQLIESLTKKAKFKSGKIFRKEMDESEKKDPKSKVKNKVQGKDYYKKALSEWIARNDRTGRATARRLANLRWDSLHRSTEGDLATSCLTLGVGEAIAAVELHYAALHVSEARKRFEESSLELWGEHFGDGPVHYDDPSPEEAGKIIGIRAFPKIEIVRDVVASLRAGSREFFKIPAQSFNFTQHADFLNRAVLYATWHQMHAFATRAIRDAYQPGYLFSRDGISTLRDKDFEDGHKARMVWADPILLAHMEAIEQRLDDIRTKTSGKKFPENGPLWFISDDGTIEEITPTTIAKYLGAGFPFPVNTPRKVMRYLIRGREPSCEGKTCGLSHEEAEVFMGHWWQSREPWSPFSSFDWGAYLENLGHLIPAILEDLGFLWPPVEPAG